MELGDQFHAPAALSLVKERPAPTGWAAKKNPFPTPAENGTPVVSP